MAKAEDILSKHLQDIRAGHSQLIAKKLCKAMLELVGEDELQYSNGRSARAVRNQLRAELRSKIRRFFGQGGEG